ncbi:MAG: hypothetical protein QG608_1011 [Actinomycetota bacterium]|nr:hypothetical protein [Actinomycetota bacterium]
MSGIGPDDRYTADGREARPPSAPGGRPRRVGRSALALGGVLLLVLAGGVAAVLHGSDGPADTGRGLSALASAPVPTGSSSAPPQGIREPGPSAQHSVDASTTGRAPDGPGDEGSGNSQPDGRAAAVPRTQDSGVRIPGATTSEQQRQVRTYWTAERMRGAEPVNGPVTGSEGSLRRPAAATMDQPVRDLPIQTWTGTPTRPGGLDDVDDRMRLTRPNAATVKTGKTWTDGGPIVRTTGKIFFTQGSGDYVCSGSSVRSSSKSTVITAAHCAWDSDLGTTVKNWIFVPGYKDGVAPYGLFSATYVAVPLAWKKDKNFDFDVAFVNVGVNSVGRRLTDVVGGQGIAFSAARGAQTHLFGYPNDPPFTGQTLMWCAGIPADDTRGTSTQGVGCTMTRGSSGGPWFTGFNPVTGLGTITSVTSFYYETLPDALWGPYLGPQIKTLFTEVSTQPAP